MDVTILEVHLPDAEFNAPFARGGGNPGTDAGTAVEAPPGGGSKAAFAALAVVVGLALLSWFLRRTEDEEGEVMEG